MRKNVLAWTILLLLGALFQGTSEAQVVVKAGETGASGDATFYIGVEKGYYKERGIELKLERFASAARMMAPLSTGELHVAGGGINPALFNGLARGLPLKIVAAHSRQLPSYSSNALMIRSDLKEQVKKFGDLKGKKVGINAKGSPQEYMLGKMMESEGLSIKDVDIVYISWPDMAPAFSRKAIDAGTLVEPLLTRFEERGFAYIWKRAADVIRDPWMEVSVIFFSKDWADKNSRVARNFMVAHIKAARDFHEYLTKGKNKEEIVGILVKNTPVKEKALYERMQIGYVDPNGFVSRESIKEQQDWWAQSGEVPRKVDLDQVIDDSYAKYALEQLGTFPVERR